ncbi:DUF1572 domain-containing protein [Tenacibaculum sp. 190524A02b]|uniref:DUF1572 domain-containing protein n=1 Tax=Tenacibaculum vairaonense TaxID=3137860 RepID=UPI0031FB8D4A
MIQSKNLANRLHEVYINGKWIANTNYKEQIENTTWQEATKKIESFNTIAALTYHINYYLTGILNVFNGGALEIKDKYSFDVPEIQSEKEWKDLVDEFLTNAHLFIAKINSLPDTILNSSFVNEKYGNYARNIEGVIEHSYYHLGQIVLIKKIISTQ